VKAKAALIGAFVADAATMPVHWIYGMDKMEAVLKGTKTPEFFNPPSCPFYSPETNSGHYSLGQPSPYGEEFMCLLNHLVKNQGDFASPESFADDLLQWAETNGGRLNHCSKQFAERRKAGAKFPACGADDYQANALIKGVLLGVRYCGLPELPEKVEQAIRVHQNDEVAVQFGVAAARAVEGLILGNSLADLVKPSADAGPKVVEFTKLVSEKSSIPTVEFLNIVADSVKLQPVMATSCALPGAYVLPLHFAVVNSSYEEGVRNCLRMGGDNCSRNVFLGALFGASGSPIPDEWLAKTTDLKAIEKLIDIVVARRASTEA